MEVSDFVAKLQGTWISPTYRTLKFTGEDIHYDNYKVAKYELVANKNVVYDHEFELRVAAFGWDNYVIEFLNDGHLQISVSYINQNRNNQLYVFKKQDS